MNDIPMRDTRLFGRYHYGWFYGVTAERMKRPVPQDIEWPREGEPIPPVRTVELEDFWQLNVSEKWEDGKVPLYEAFINDLRKDHPVRFKDGAELERIES